MTHRRPPQTSSRRRLYVAAVIGVGLVLLGAVFSFVKDAPFRGGYDIAIRVSSANQLRPGAAVRVAGIDVGEVTGIDGGPGNASTLRVHIDSGSPRLSTDAEAKVLPRLFFEGNAYVRLSPGTPGSPPLQAGGTIPLSRTTVAVQLDQVLNVLDRPNRTAMLSTAREVDRGLAGRGGSGTGTNGLRRATRELGRALQSVRGASRAVRGTTPGDLPDAIDGVGTLAGEIATDPRALSAIVLNTSRVTGALAAQDAKLAQTLRELEPTLRSAPASFARLDRSFPTFIRLGDRLVPALRAVPAPLRSTHRALAQIASATQPAELPRTLRALSPATAIFPSVSQRLQDAAPLLQTAMSCVRTHVIPTLNMTVPDGNLSTGRPVWQDAFHMTAALAGGSPNFDGNGTTIRLGVTESEQALEGSLPGIGEITGAGGNGGGSLNPTWLGYGVEPAYRPDQPCAQQQLPDLGARDSARMTGLRLVDKPQRTRADTEVATPSAARLRALVRKMQRSDR